MKVKQLITAGILGCALWMTAQNNIIEEVAWIIGDEPIYKSEIDEAYQDALQERDNIQGDPY